MASEVGICNMALALLGDRATVSSIDPPEGSAQASSCATFYPIARDALQEMHDWSFCTRRAPLALLAAPPPSQWAYVYSEPGVMVNILAVTASDASNDYSTPVQLPYTQCNAPNDNTGFGLYTPQPYVLESLSDGTSVIYTDQQNAVMRYTTLVADTSKFTPLFTTTLAHLLASYLAGPVLKGEVGRAESAAQLKLAMSFLSQAKTSDANQRRATPVHNVAWLGNR